MLVLRRKEDQWIEVTHRSGDLLRIHVYEIGEGRVNIAFEDDAKHFSIQRPERFIKAREFRSAGVLLGTERKPPNPEKE